ncbi:hypothetical protein CRM22_008180 [Opisthorchis felineus]|uniref:Uncharacterized protein n=1 Tax=Opisthorchis felineus TaxID=147828 RepID=A0A4V3SDK9_OPIFE|nr:hypothetical protein CRM22_008180 [Opisthorchis felineus]
MPEGRRSRASSSKALKAISKMARRSSDKDDDEDDETEENASDLSGSVYENESETDSSSNSSPSSVVATSDEPKTPHSDSADDSTVGRRRSGRLKRTSLTAARMTLTQRNPTTGATETSDRTKVQSSHFSPLCWVLAACRRRLAKSIKQMSIDHFSKAIEALKISFKHAEHPFAFQPSILYKEAFQVRQDALFATTFMWHPYNYSDTLAFLPRPASSPMLSVEIPASTTESALPKESAVKRLKRFEFDREKNLLYVGGFVKSIAWCPTRLYKETVSTESSKDPTYLAIATYPTPGTRVPFSDPPSVTAGLIQIWNCGQMGLLKPSTWWRPEPHIFVAHDWGHVLHLCWLPIPVTLAVRTLYTTNAPSPWIHRTLGHLIVACQDGYVRVFSVPRFILDTVYFGTKRSIPLYRLNDKCVMKLSPSAIKHPDWIGWPTQLHIRAQYPNRLFVGYSRGHVALYDLSCVNPMYFNAAECHLAPVRLFHLINGPVRSMSLNCVNGRMLLVQGMNFHIQVWDIEDSIAQTADSPEMSYSVNHGLPGSEVLWHSRGDMWFFSRENTFQRRALLNSRGVPMRNYADLITQSDNLVGMTMFPAAPDSLRHLIPLGLQCVTRLDLSEPLNTLLCATDRGRLELVLCTLDGRSNLTIKERYLSQMRVPVCQWTMEQVEFTAESLDDVFRRLTASKCYILPASATFTPPALSNDFSDPSCGDCTSERSFCWHKLWSSYKLTAQIEDQVPMKPSADYFKTPFLSISEARFCPNVESATWIAIGTACGFVQFYCADFLYLSEFSELLNEAEVSSSSSCLNSGKMAEIKSISTPYIWRHSRVKVGASDTQNVARRRALRTAREGLPKGISRPHSRISLLSTSRRENVSLSDSDTTEAMTDITDERADASSDTRKRVTRRRTIRSSYLILTDSEISPSSDSDQTEPCTG